MSDHGFEANALERLIPDLKADGYDVVREPGKDQLPVFLKNYRPDLIAYRGNEKIAFEFKRNSEREKYSLEAISKLFEGHKDWEFRVVWLSNSDNVAGLKRQSKQKVLEFYQQSLDLAAKGSFTAAFLLAWATLEAAARRALGNDLAKPQTPGRVVEQLASLGYLTPAEADDLRSLASLRNKIIHGELDTALSKEVVDSMLLMLGTVISLSGKQTTKVA